MEMGLEVETASEAEVALEVAQAGRRATIDLHASLILTAASPLCADEKQADYMAVTRTLARLRSIPVRV